MDGVLFVVTHTCSYRCEGDVFARIDDHSGGMFALPGVGDDGHEPPLDSFVTDSRAAFSRRVGT